MELHALALENAVVLPGEDVADDVLGANLNLADLLQYFLWDHGQRT